MLLVEPHSGRQYTYSQFIDKARRAACGFSRHGVKKGDVVLLISPNDIDYGVAFLALASIGAITTTASHLSTEREIKNQMKNTEVSHILCSFGLLNKLQHLVEEFPIKQVFTFGNEKGFISMVDLMSEKPDDSFLNSVELDPNDVILILNSSGTTGAPKGVMHTHKSIISMTLCSSHPESSQMRDPDKPGSECVIFNLPLCGGYGLLYIFLETLYCGGKLVIMVDFDMTKYLALVVQYKATVMYLMPPMVVELTKRLDIREFDISSVHTITCSGAPFGKKLSEEAAELLNVNLFEQIYGMTEACVITGTINGLVKSGSVGRPLLNFKLKIKNPTTGENCGPNQSGHLLVKGSSTMKGYFKRPDATENTIDKDGWLQTGDIAYYDEEGFIYIIDRLKDIIKYQGYQVSPAELEDVLLMHEDIADAAVFGVPDEDAGEIPAAFVVKKFDKDPPKENILHFVEENVMSNKYIRGGIRFVDAIPKSPTGKILRRECAREWAAGLVMPL